MSTETPFTPPRLRALLAALLVTTVIALYARVARYDFISIDDAEYVYENPRVATGLSWANVAWALKTPVTGNWHPLTMLSHMADCQLYGPSAGAQHLTNLLFHTANTLLLFWLLLRLTHTNQHDRITPLVPRPSPLVPQLWPCALVAALFALHPLHVESVAWVSERKDVLSAFFFLLTLLAYAKYVSSLKSKVQSLKPGAIAPGPRHRSALRTPHSALESSAFRIPQSALEGSAFRTPHSAFRIPHSAFESSAFWYVLSLLLFALGLLSKPMLVTLPFVLLLLDYWPLRRLQVSGATSSSRRSVPKRASAPASAVQGSRFKVRGSRFVLPLLEKLPFLALTLLFSILTYHLQNSAGAVVGLEDYPLRERLGNAMVSYARYLAKTLWPQGLAMPYPYLPSPAWQVAGSTLLVLALSVLALASVRRRPCFFVGWFWFVGMLVPTIGLVQAGMQSMADRYTYLPHIGVFIALAWGLTAMPRLVARPRLLGLGAAVLLSTLAAITWTQVGCWKNSQSLFEHAARVVPNNSVAHYFLGAIFDSQGQPERAATEFAESIRCNPANVRARCGLGYILCLQGKLEAAAHEYEVALQSQPSLAKAHFGLAEVLRRQGRTGPALAEYLATLQLKPDLAEAHYQVAGLYALKHEPAVVIAHLLQAVRWAPDWPLPLNDLAWALATESQDSLRNGPEALRLAERAVSLTRRENPGTLDTLAAAYAEAGRFPDAVSTAQLAIQLANASGQTNLALDIAPRLNLYASQKPYRE